MSLHTFTMEELRAVLMAGLSANLPPGYQWGADAFNAFEFGKMRAVEEMGRSLGLDQISHAEAVRLIREMIAHEPGDMARDSVTFLQDWRHRARRWLK